jgi:hypothetical protein
MARKLTMLGMVAAALAALVVPAAASATPQLFNATSGKAVAVGSSLMGTAVAPVKTTETKFGTLTCNTVSIGAELTKNSGTAIEAKSVNPATNAATVCTTSKGLQLKIDEPTLTSLVTNNTTTDEGTLGLSYKATIGTEEPPTTCTFSGSGPFTYKTGTGNDILTVSGISLNGPGACKLSEKLPIFEGEFTLEVDTGGGVMDPVFVG